MDPSQPGQSQQTAQSAQSPELSDNPGESRFELRVGGELAGFMQYHRRGQLINLIHTEVGGAYQGAGLAGKLARFALDTARRDSSGVLPSCPYVRTWIARHPEYAELVPEGRRAEFGIS
jgi:predicted GNAT family acetyltransferase